MFKQVVDWKIMHSDAEFNNRVQKVLLYCVTSFLLPKKCHSIPLESQRNKEKLTKTC